MIKSNDKMRKNLFLLTLATFVAVAFTTSCKEETAVEPSWYTNQPYFLEKHTLYAELPVDTSNIVLVGDDFIDRGMWSDFFGSNKVLGRGITYDGTEHLRYRIGGITKAKPKKLFLSAGARDIMHGDDNTIILERVAEICNIVKKSSPESEIYYIGVTPLEEMTVEQVAQTAELNTSLAESADEIGYTFIDMASVLTDESGAINPAYSWNGMLLNGAGYEAYAKAIESFVGLTALNKAQEGEVKAERFDHYNHRLSIFRSLPNSEEFSVIMLGNSLINNAPWNELFPFINILNRGISGDVVEGIIDRIDEIADENASKIFLMTSTNDLLNDQELPISELWAKYESLIIKLKEAMPKAILYVQSTLPLNPKTNFYEGNNERVFELNKLLDAAQDRYGYIYLDIASLLSDANGDLADEYTTDGIHLSATGYFVWAKKLAEGHRILILEPTFE
jgi:lysophospholipase L1-like esterase